jgi:hypothetical protein
LPKWAVCLFVEPCSKLIPSVREIFPVYFTDHRRPVPWEVMSSSDEDPCNDRIYCVNIGHFA